MIKTSIPAHFSIIAIIAVAFCVMPASAQFKGFVHQPKVAIASSLNVLNTPQKGANVASRLFATSVYGYNTATSQPVLGDTTVYTYSTSLPLQISSLASFVNDIFDYAYDTNGYLHSVTEHSNTGILIRRHIYTNNTAGYVLVDATQNWSTTTNAWENVFKIQYTRDANNGITAYLNQSWNANTNSWQNYEERLYLLNGQENPVKTTIQQWNNLNASWDSTEVSQFSYDPSGLIKLDETLFGVSATMPYLYPLNLTKYINNPSGMPDSAYVFEWNSGWTPILLYTYTYNAQGLQTRMLYQSLDTVSNNYMNYLDLITTYNSYNQKIRDESHLWVSGAWVPLPLDPYQYNYYYEPYSTAVINTSANVPTLHISPVPAADNLRINIEWDKPQAANIAITDMTGRVLRIITMPAASDSKYDVSVANLPAGNYMLSIKGSNGGGAARMITVAH